MLGAGCGADGNDEATFLVEVQVQGGIPGTEITPVSSAPGASCMPGSCRVPVGATVTATAPALLDWYFNGWAGDEMSTAQTITLDDVRANTSVVAAYINTRMEPCLNAAPPNATTTGMTMVAVSYTTAGGWATPALCPWQCNPDACLSGGGTTCASRYLDEIVHTASGFSGWYGGDDRPGFGPRLVGAGQGVTPNTTITLARFGLRIAGPFTFASNATLGGLANMLRLDVRSASGTILNTYMVSLPPGHAGEWIFWETPSTTLTSSTLYIFTSFLSSAFTQQVNTGVLGDLNQTYAGGTAYSAQVTSGDLVDWSHWSAVTLDYNVRLQSLNPTCN